MKYIRYLLFLSLAALLCLLPLVSCGGADESETYSFSSGSVTLTPGALAGDSLTALGDPLSFSESGSCGGIPGTDKVYLYKGFTVYTVPGTEGDTISEIVLTDDSVKTPDGLAIGSTKQAVTDALGAGTLSGDALIYVGGGTRLTFSFRDGKVTGIRYGISE